MGDPVGIGQRPLPLPGKGRNGAYWGNETNERHPQYRIELSPKLYRANSLDCKSRRGRKRD